MDIFLFSFPLALTVIFIVIHIVIFLFSQKPKSTFHLPPSPKGLPIIGNLHQIESRNPQSILKLAKEWGPIMSLKLGSRTLVIISSSELAKELLKTQDINFSSRPLFGGQQKLSYNGLDLGFGPYTKYYKEMRKLCMVNIFSPSRVQTFKPVRVEETKKILETVSKRAETLDTIDLSELLLSFTNSIVCRQAFGRRFTENGKEMRKFIDILFRTQSMLGSMFYSDIFPCLGFLDKLTGLKSCLDKTFKDLDAYLQEKIHESLDPNRNKPESESFIDLLMQLLETQPFSVEFTHDNVKAMMMDIIVPGTDTAASVVTWTMAYLMQYPKAMKKVQQEIRTIIGNKGFVTEEDIQNLPYLKAVIKESFRLDPTTPILLHREAVQDTKIGGYDIPAKTIVRISAWAISRDKQVWGDNSDEFCPERFFDKSIDIKGQDFDLLPFGSGRRMCPGMNFGIATLELPLANLLYKFDWEMPKGVKAKDVSMDVMDGYATRRKVSLLLCPKAYKFD